MNAYQQPPQGPYYNNQQGQPYPPQVYPPQAYAQPYGQAGYPAYGDAGAADYVDPADLSHPAVAAFVRRVYTYFGTALLVTALAALGGTFLVDHLIVTGNTGAVSALWMGSLVAYMVSFLVVVFSRKSHSPMKTALLYVFAGAAGVSLAPMLTALVGAGMGMAIVMAFGVAAFTFFGLTAYTLMTGKDFRSLGGLLVVGCFALLGIVLLSLFIPFPSITSQLITMGGFVLFMGFVLFDTSRVVRDNFQANDAVSAAINLLYDFFMLFRYALYLIASRD
ncbi:MAG: US12 family protein [Planctomycetes bacterium]|nr:US12 family protein [Planctomycetota bacterium]